MKGKPEIRKKRANRLLFGVKTRINPVIEPIVREFKTSLQTLYGDRLHDVVLYGSYARGDYDEESDIDLMVLLNDETVNTYAELFRLSDITMDFILRYGKAVSVLPASVKRYQQSFGSVYQNARREGVLV
ncbi:MAG: nucleotidyltransferase domain-containing protein [Spirosoma sp.]|nr:nucleotidyltransferase domain-containing protein [Spirosoma sp.]OJW74181.1 MAG: DNA polymerase subunit beta [Spirosoma sp. 48-14]